MTIDKFIKIYKNCTTLDELVKETGLGFRTIIEYRRKLRKSGVNLPKLKTRGGRTAINKEFLEKVWNESTSFREVVEKTKYNPYTVYSYCRKYNLKKFKRTKKTDNQQFLQNFINAWNNAENVNEIMEKMHLSRHAVARYAQVIKKLGYKLKNFKNPKVSAEKFIEAYNRLKKTDEVAKILNMKLNAAYVQATRLRKKGLIT